MTDSDPNVPTLASVVKAHTRTRASSPAFGDLAGDRQVSWTQYLAAATALAGAIAGYGVQPRQRVGLVVPDGIRAHVAFLGCELAGVVALGIGAKSGDREIAHLLKRTQATLVISTASEADRLRAVSGLDVVAIDTVAIDTVAAEAAGDTSVDDDAGARSFNAHELWFLNSTSGTTGLPKVVRHNQARWVAFHHLAVEAAHLDRRDIFASLVPAPFGFGLWTSHFTPTLLGAPCFVADRFDAATTLAAVEREKISVLSAVPTQLAMLMACPDFEERDLSSLRVVFTGGEMLPFDRGVAFEERTGAALLQFYGSNETGALSRTTLHDSRDVRLRTAGRLIASMDVRLVDDRDLDVSAGGGPAVPCCRGPLLSLGYDNDDDANALLYTTDGWMKMGDLVTIDPPSEPPISPDAVLTVVGRTADLIIRGGKNISAPQVEEEVSTHPSVALVAVAAVPDPVFGERVCAYVVLKQGAPLTLPDLTAHLASRGVGKELWPELLVIAEGDLPRNAGGKVAKHVLRSLHATSD